MRKYNRRILLALVVAYKRGIINIKPLNKWLKSEEILYQILKYVTYIVLISTLFILIEFKLLGINFDSNIYVGYYFIPKSNLILGLLIGILVFNLYKLGKYLIQVIIVKKAMKEYKISDNDVEMVNRVTFKINV
ncbi:MAG TPA: hypothetical protein VIK84_07360 [Haloplasmataceae bacterium]